MPAPSTFFVRRPGLAGTVVLLLAATAAAGATSATAPSGTVQPAAPDAKLAQQWLDRADRFASRRFDVVTDLPRDRAEPLAAHMDVMHDAYRSALGRFSERGGSKRQLWLIERAEDYVRVIDRAFDEDVRRVPGMALQDGSTTALVACIQMTRQPGAPDADARLRHLLQHEGFHQAQMTMFPDMPLWAVEGVAELFGLAVVVGDAAILGEVPADRLARLREASRSRRLQPLQAFMQVETDEDIQDVVRGEEKPQRWNADPSRLYGDLRFDQAWAIVHMMMYARDGAYRDEFTAFLGALNRGRSGQGAWAEAFGNTSPQSLEAPLVAWIDGLTATDMGATVQRLRYLAEGMLAILESEEDPVVPTDFAALRERLTAMKHVGSPATGELTAEAEVFDGGGFALVACGRRLPPCIAATAPGPVQLGVKWQRAGRDGVRWTFVWE